MSAILNRHDEAQWALIAQRLKTCTPKLQLSFEPILLDELETPWTMDKLLQILIALELKGVVVSEQGYFSRV